MLIKIDLSQEAARAIALHCAVESLRGDLMFSLEDVLARAKEYETYLLGDPDGQDRATDRIPD